MNDQRPETKEERQHRRQAASKEAKEKSKKEEAERKRKAKSELRRTRNTLQRNMYPGRSTIEASEPDWYTGNVRSRPSVQNLYQRQKNR